MSTPIFSRKQPTNPSICFGRFFKPFNRYNLESFVVFTSFRFAIRKPYPLNGYCSFKPSPSVNVFDMNPGKKKRKKMYSLRVVLFRMGGVPAGVCVYSVENVKKKKLKKIGDVVIHISIRTIKKKYVIMANCLLLSVYVYIIIVNSDKNYRLSIDLSGKKKKT